MQRASILFTTLLLLLGYVAIIQAQYLSSSVAREGYQMWEPFINSATQVALEQLNRDKSAANSLHLSSVNLENTKVAQGVMYTVGLEMDIASMKNSRYQMSFLEPTSEFQPLWASLPALEASPPATARSAPLSTALAVANEHHHQHHPQSPSLAMTLRGPLEVFLHDGRSAELHIKAPREVDVGYVDKIVLANGVNMTVSGFHELYLTEPLSLLSPPTIVDGTVQMSVKQTPKVAFVGRSIEISNASAEEPLKVKKKGFSDIEIVSASDRPTSTAIVPFELPINDSRVQTLQYFLGQLATSNNAQPVVRRLFSAKLEAVNSFYIPMAVRSTSGELTNWDVVVAQSRKAPPRIVSLEKKHIGVEIAFDAELARNGTLSEAIESFLAERGSQYRIMS